MRTSEKTAKAGDFFKRRQQLLAQNLERRPALYVLKEMWNQKPLTKEAIVREHIGSALYRLLGLTNPELRIVKKSTDGETQYALASKIMSGYSDVRELLGGDEAVSEIDEKETLEERIAKFQEIVKQRHIHFRHKERLLVAGAMLAEFDLLGRDYSNVGAIHKAKGQYELVKIDPGAVDLDTPLDEFKKKTHIKNLLLNEDFSLSFLNNPHFLAGNHHFLEFFNDIDKDKMLEALSQLAQISDDEIRRHIVRDEYLELVSQSFLTDVADTMIARKNYMLSLVDKQPVEVSKEYPLLPVMLPRFYLTDTIIRIHRGQANPKVVLGLAPEQVLDGLKSHAKSA